jgi:hypothetical protein
MVPRVPELRISVDEHDQGSLAGLDVMQPHFVEVRVTLLEATVA